MKSLKNLKVKELGLLVFIIAICVLVQIINPSFLTSENIGDLIKNASILAVLAVGMMMVLISGGIDLSIGSTLALSGMASSMLVFNYPDTNVFVALIVGIAVGTFCGIVLGVLISYGGISPIIASLGMMNVYRGLTYRISGGKWISAYQMNDQFKGLSTGNIMGINTLIVFAVIILAIFYYFLTYTRTGRNIYAVGSNSSAAEITGINKNLTLTMVYGMMGMLAGLSGVLWVSKFASAQGDTASGYELNVIAACVLGGVSVSGGRGKISGLILGVLLLGILQNALPLINVSPFWQTLIQGFVIISAIVINVFVKRNSVKTALLKREI